MKTLMLFILIATFVEFGTAQTLEKDVIATSGESYTNGEMNLSWTVGQTVTGTFFSPDETMSISQGFHTGIPLNGNAIQKMNFDSNGSIMLYPNPVENTLYVKFFNSKEGDYSYEIYNSQGKIVIQKNDLIIDMVNPVDVGNLSPGVYFYTVIYDQGKKAQHTFIKE